MDAAEEQWGRDRLILANQVQNLLLALRSNGRFGSKTRFVNAALAPEHPLLRGLRELQQQLMRPSLAQPIGEERILEPFCAVCASAESGDTIIAVVLAALANLVDRRCFFITSSALDRLIRAASNIFSEPMETESHELVLLRCLQLCVSCAGSPCARDLPEHCFVDMVARAYELAVHPDASLVLQRTAEKAMKDIVFALYAPITNPNNSPQVATGVEMLHFVCGLIAGNDDSGGGAANGVRGRKAIAQLEGLWLAQAMLFAMQDRLGGALLRAVQHNLSRALLIAGVATEDVIVLTQLLRTVHIVIKFASVDVVPQTFSFIKVLHIDPILRITEELHAQSFATVRGGASPRVATAPSMPLVASPAPRTPAQVIDLYERREVLLESLAEICTDAHFAAFCYEHYDLSQRFFPLLDRLCNVLAGNCFAVEEMDVENDRGISETGHFGDVGINSNLNQSDVLALDAITGLLQQTTLLAGLTIDSSTKHDLTVPVTAQLEEKKRLMKFAALFQKDAAKEGIPFLLRAARRVPLGSLTSECDAFVLEEPVSGREIGACLFRLNDILDKRVLGDYLGELGREPPAPGEEAGDDARAAWELERAEDHLRPGSVRFYEQQLAGFLGSFDYANKSLLSCIRETAYRMCMPGEAQKIDRVMEAFAKHWMEANRGASEDINPFRSDQGPFIIAFSLIMLNTDQHSGKMMRPMTQTDFLRVHRDSDGGNNLPEEYLNHLFDDVKAHPIIMAEMINAGFSNDVTWALEMHESYMPPRSKGSKAFPIFSMQGVKGDVNEEVASEVLRPFIFDVVWPYSLRAYANTLDRCSQCLERQVREASANGSKSKAHNEKDDEDKVEDAHYDNNGDAVEDDDEDCAPKKAYDSNKEDDCEKEEQEVGDEADETGKTVGDDREWCGHSVTFDSAETASVCSAEGAYNSALAGLALLAHIAQARGVSSAVDQVLLELIEQIGVDRCDTHDAISWLGARPHVMRALRVLLSVARDCLAVVDNAWGPLATCLARLFLLGAISLPPPRSAGPLAAVWEDVRAELRRAARAGRGRHRRVHSSWLSAFWSAGSDASASYSSSDSAAARRVRAALPSVSALLWLFDGAEKPGARAAVVCAVCEVAAGPATETQKTRQSQRLCSSSSIALVLAAAIVARRPAADFPATERFADACEQSLAAAAALMTETATTPRAEGALSRAANRIVSAAGGVIAAAAQQRAPKCAKHVLSALSHSFSSHSAALRVAAAPFAAALCAATAGGCRDASVVRAALRAVPLCAAEPEALRVVHRAADFALPPGGPGGPEEAAGGAEGGGDEGGGALAAEEGAELAVEALAALSAISAAGAGGAVEAAAALYRRIPAQGPPWDMARKAAMHTFATLVLSARIARDRVEALLCLESCLLVTDAREMTPTDVATLYEEIMFPLINRMGARATTGNPNPNINTNTIVGTTLVSSLFGSFAPPPQQHQLQLLEYTQQQQQQLQDAAGLRCRVVALLTKTFLFYAQLLAEEQRTLQELWNRIFGTLYALYTDDVVPNTDSNELSALREAIHETVKNMVYVFATTPRDSKGCRLMDRELFFWTETKKLLRGFDFAEPLLAYIDTLEGELTSPAT